MKRLLAEISFALISIVSIKCQKEKGLEIGRDYIGNVIDPVTVTLQGIVTDEKGTAADGEII